MKQKTFFLVLQGLSRLNFKINEQKCNGHNLNHSSCESRDVFFPQLLKLSHVPVVFKCARVRTSLQLNRIARSILARCQGSCGTVPIGPPSSVVSFNMRKDMRC